MMLQASKSIFQRVRSSSPGLGAAAAAASPSAARSAAAPHVSSSDAGVGAGTSSLQALLDYSLAHPNQQLGGPGGHPVLQLLRQRLHDGSMPGNRAAGDGAKLGLVVEGGGMRGIVTGAMLMGLQEQGLLNQFDAVYGASAGAINLTYFISGE
jgi:hypothetical protein